MRYKPQAEEYRHPAQLHEASLDVGLSRQLQIHQLYRLDKPETEKKNSYSTTLVKNKICQKNLYVYMYTTNELLLSSLGTEARAKC